ncbi:protein RGF1 INDUCIBLE TRANSCRIPTION FACTOR 1-like isoform X1 [Gossypium arboreum]|uniref:protein RGF1 INDUCIBLE TRANSCRIPTION FACTOR 1-like isoform X1 n=1 Tax=Gossypium arboreum TaxID=29729 RepID=UPI0008191176|nr:protein RGF1 INDUCIBLE TRANSCRIPTION FACTOR 1-like isoform X1 [Gossypium arboreum]
MLISSHLPRWLQVLLTEKFFNACVIHEEAKKNEKNVYCLDCCISICPHCLSPHSSHRLLQIRRYVYHDVIRLDDATKLMDCASVQSYIINSAKVIFINQRPQTRQFRGSGNFCTTCDRCLQHPYLFCSLSCKVSFLPHNHHLPIPFFDSPHFLIHFTYPQIDNLLRTEYGLSKFLYDCNYLPLPDVGLDDGLVTPEWVLEPSGSTKTSSGSDGYGEEAWCRALSCTATTEIVRKKRSSLTCPSVSGSLMNRRKKPPHRAPLY